MKGKNGKEVMFTCQHCKKKFAEADGTWLPIGEDEPEFMNVIERRGPLTIYAWDLRKPEIITSDKFTCYDCL